MRGARRLAGVYRGAGAGVQQPCSLCLSRRAAPQLDARRCVCGARRLAGVQSLRAVTGVQQPVGCEAAPQLGARHVPRHLRVLQSWAPCVAAAAARCSRLTGVLCCSGGSSSWHAAAALLRRQPLWKEHVESSCWVCYHVCVWGEGGCMPEVG